MLTNHELESKMADLTEDVIKSRRNKMPEHVIQLCDTMLTICAEHEFKYEEAFAHYHYGEACYHIGDSRQLITHAFRGIAIAKHYEFVELECRCYNLLGAFFTYQGDLQTAFNYYLQGLDLAKRHHSKEMLLIFYNNLGDLNIVIKDYDAAIYYFNKVSCSSNGESEEKTLADMYYECVKFSNLVDVNLLVGEYEKAQSYMCQMLKHLDDSYFKVIACLVYRLLVRINYARGYIDQAYACEELFVKYALENRDKSYLIDTYIPMGSLLIERDRLENAKILIDLIVKMSDNITNAYILVKIAELKVEYYKKINDKDHLLEAYEEFFSLQRIREREEEKARKDNIKLQMELHQTVKLQQDIMKKNEELKEMSEHDALTGLANRYSIRKYYEQMFLQARQEQLNYGVIIIDVDFFKQYNDRYGHIKGDQCICAIANKIKELSGEQLVTARYGGDEFLVMGYDKDDEYFHKFAEHLREEIENLKIPHADSKVSDYVTVTMGVVNLIPKRCNDTLIDFIQMADLALYKVKRKIRNIVGYYEDIEV